MKRNRGFTLVELLIVVIIVAVVATIAIPKFSNSSIRAKESRLKLFMQSVRDATERFHNDTNLWPQSTDLLTGATPTQGLDDTGTLKAVTATDYHGPYFDQESFTVGIAGITSITYVNATGGPFKVGTWKVTSSATASDGTAYSTW